jgi:hypothetical protein
MRDSPYDRVSILHSEVQGYRMAAFSGAHVKVGLRVHHPKVFMPLDFAFSPGRAYVSESGGPVSCIDIRTGHVSWQWSAGPATHAVQVAYNHDSGKLCAVVFPYQEGDTCSLFAIDVGTGTAEETISAAIATPAAFCQKGTMLVSADGAVRATKDGRLINQLDFDLDSAKMLSNKSLE